jgi:hypothetical protein
MAMAIEPVDALEWVRARPRQFFGQDVPDALALLVYLLGDVIGLGKGECIVRPAESWWIVGSDIPWLTHPKLGIPDLFRNVVPAPSHGEHSMRGEVLVGAFARDVAVITGGNLVQVKGQPPRPEIVRKALGMSQAVLFCL